jgi:hypothetical protein
MVYSDVPTTGRKINQAARLKLQNSLYANSVSTLI